MDIVRVAPEGGIELWSVALTNSYQMRRASANAATMRLPYTLDFRLDTVLSDIGVHTLWVVDVDTDNFADHVVHCEAALKFAFTPGVFAMKLSFRLRDYVSFEPAQVSDNPSKGEGPFVWRTIPAGTEDHLRRDDLTPDENVPSRKRKGTFLIS